MLSQLGIDIERKNRLLKVCYVPATGDSFSKAFLAMSIDSTNEKNKAGSMGINQYIFLDVYAIRSNVLVIIIYKICKHTLLNEVIKNAKLWKLCLVYCAIYLC